MMIVDSIAVIRSNLVLKAASNKAGGNWSFTWNGRAITATVEDTCRTTMIDAAIGGIVDATFEEVARLNGAGDLVKKRTYRVVNVHGVTPTA